MRKIFRLAEKTLFFSAEKKMNDHRLPENGLKAGKQIAENTVFSLFGKKRHARMRCPLQKVCIPGLTPPSPTSAGCTFPAGLWKAKFLFH